MFLAVSCVEVSLCYFNILFNIAVFLPGLQQGLGRLRKMVYEVPLRYGNVRREMGKIETLSKEQKMDE